jgi:putative glutamine amidotransferase
MSMGSQARKGHDYQVMTRKYLTPLVELSGCLPLLAPSCFGPGDIGHYLDIADGVYLTGAGTNIDPALYGQENLVPQKELDRDRDSFDFPLIHGALERGLPFFGVCRGMQELNVALGGDLHQKLYAVPGFMDHREDATQDVAAQYAQAHRVKLLPGTWFSRLLEQDEIDVNSLHGQGLDRLGDGVQALAHSSDGLVEAVHLPGFPQFSLGVQWHPEWRAAQNPVSVRMYQAFGAACHQFAARRMPR